MGDPKDASAASEPPPGPRIDATSKIEAAPKADAAPKVAAPKRNPAFQMMGLPNIRARLPGRNWLIFWSIIASWSGAVYYDRREKKRIQKKWCDAVSHLALEPLPPSVQQRKLTIFLSAPPGDGLIEAREHFHEYVRPILVSAGLDWDAIEGRKEGDVRAAFAEWIRRRRKLQGESTQEPVDEMEESAILEDARQRMGVREWPGPAGDLVIGRNTWKEYVRGLHEGWLGPVDTPADVRRAMEEAERADVEEKPAEKPIEDKEAQQEPPPEITYDAASSDPAPDVPALAEGTAAFDSESTPKGEKKPVASPPAADAVRSS